MTMGGPIGRTELTARFGALAMDRIHAHWTCARSGRTVEDGALRSVGTVSYRDLDGLVAESRIALSAEQTAIPSCPSSTRTPATSSPMTHSCARRPS
jgi:hypothetical protein